MGSMPPPPPPPPMPPMPPGKPPPRLPCFPIEREPPGPVAPEPETGDPRRGRYVRVIPTVQEGPEGRGGPAGGMTRARSWRGLALHRLNRDGDAASRRLDGRVGDGDGRARA